MMLKYFCSVLLLFLTMFCQAQSVWEKLNKDPFKASQMYVGLKSGASFTMVNVINRHSLLKPTQTSNEGLYDKKYQQIENISAIYGLTFLYQFNQKLVVGANVSVNQVRFQYVQEQPNASTLVKFTHNH